MKNEEFSFQFIEKKIVKIVCNYLVNKKLVSNTNTVICLISLNEKFGYSLVKIVRNNDYKKYSKKIENNYS
jgi:hypothetical protein